MNQNPHKLLVVFVVVYSSIASANWWGTSPLNQGSDRIRLADSAECTSSNTPNKRLEIGNTETEDGVKDTYVKFTYEFGSDTKKLDCNAMYNLQVKRQQLDLERLRVEVEVLQLQKQKLIKSSSINKFNIKEEW
jgi:hypothetical protein